MRPSTARKVGPRKGGPGRGRPAAKQTPFGKIVSTVAKSGAGGKAVSAVAKSKGVTMPAITQRSVGRTGKDAPGVVAPVKPLKSSSPNVKATVSPRQRFTRGTAPFPGAKIR